MGKAKNLHEHPRETLRINIMLKGLYAAWAKEIKDCGLATSNHDLVNQAIKMLYMSLTDERLKIAKLKAMEKAQESESNA
jgi:hypothetical protein